MTLPLKPEPSLATLGRAKAKGTGLDWVNPRLSPLYVQDKAGVLPTYTMPQAQVDDVTATPLTDALMRWVHAQQAPPSPLVAVLGELLQQGR